MARAPDDVLRAAAADVDHEQRALAMWGGGRPQEGQARLLFPRDDADIEAVAVVDERPELVAVRRVACGAGGQRDRLPRLELVDDRLVFVQHAGDALDG